MAIAFTTSWKNETPASPVSLTVSPAADAYLIGISASDAASGTTTTGGSPSSALTIHDEFNCTVDGQHSASAAGKAVGNETAITFTNAASAVIGLVASFSGVDTTTPNDVARVAVTDNTSGTTVAGTIAPTSSNTMIVFAFAMDQTTTTNPALSVSDTAGLSWSFVQASEASGFRKLVIAYALKAASGSTTVTITSNQSMGGGGSLYALREAAGGSSTIIPPFGRQVGFSAGR